MSTQIRKSSQHSCPVMQDSRSQIREAVLSQMRGSTLLFIHGLFNEEIESLCGAAFSRKEADGYHRGGWDPGSVMLEGQRMAVKKPRAKKAGKDVALHSYRALQGFDLRQEKVLKHMMSGVSTRKYDGLLDDRRGPGNSDSVISGSLASPKPPGGGKPEERGDEENETQSRGHL